MLHPNVVLDYASMRLFLEGKREGKVSTILELCADGLIDREMGAERLNMSLCDFDYLYELRKPKKNEPGEDDEDS